MNNFFKKTTKLFILIAFTMHTGMTQGQQLDLTYPSKFLLGVSYISSFDLYNYSFNQFTSMYNQQYGPYLTQGFTPIKAPNHYGIRGGMRVDMDGFIIDVGLSKDFNTKYESVATLRNKDKHYLSYDMKNIFGMYNDYGITFFKTLTLGGGFTVHYYQGAMQFYTQYPNGMISYAEDNPLNGYFQMEDKFIKGFNAFADLNIWRLSFNVRMEWLKYGTTGGEYVVPAHKDRFMEANYDAGLFTDGQIKSYLPQDPSQIYNTLITSGSQQGPVMNGMFKSKRIVATVFFNLFTLKQK